MRIALVLLLSASCATAPAPEPPAIEAISLFGKPLVAPPLSVDVRREREAQLTAAHMAYEANPDDADAIVWLGRRTAYLGRYNNAIGIFSEGIVKHANDARFYRHRGHRYISTRKFDFAIADLERAAMLVRGKEDEIEPDGLPNARNIPTSTLQSNIFYHLGLAYYLDGNFEKALDAYRECMKVSTNPDMRCATSHWLYMTLQRLGRGGEARSLLKPIRRDMDVIENRSYHRLLLMYKGELPVDSLLAPRTGDQAA
ncbi:MAG TPA: tetratricopeptide repeat protein, partial [Thermoanaerobaculia bacterium]